MIEKMVNWSKREYPLLHRIAGTLLAGLVLIVLLPMGIIWTSAPLDRWLGFKPLSNNVIEGIGVGFFFLGFLLAWMSIIQQMSRGRGSPLPVMATQELLRGGVFKLCRNPMALGTILLYLGGSLWFGSLAAIGIVLVLSSLLLVYIKKVEEVELELRFGDTDIFGALSHFSW